MVNTEEPSITEEKVIEEKSAMWMKGLNFADDSRCHLFSFKTSSL